MLWLLYKKGKKFYFSTFIPLTMHTQLYFKLKIELKTKVKITVKINCFITGDTSYIHGQIYHTLQLNYLSK